MLDKLEFFFIELHVVVFGPYEDIINIFLEEHLAGLAYI